MRAPWAAVAVGLLAAVGLLREAWFHLVSEPIRTLPPVVGNQRALELLYTGERVRGEDAHRIGLCDRLVPTERLRHDAIAFAAEIAASAPLAIRSIRQTMRGGLAERVREATAHELEEQGKLFGTTDFAEGVAASAERRAPDFRGE